MRRKFLNTLLVLASVSMANAEEVVSPDREMTVRWIDQSPDMRTISVLRSGSSLWHVKTFQRWTGAVWSPDSKRCIIWNAPDNANTALWLVRQKRGGAKVIALDYEAVCLKIENAFPELHRDVRDGLTRGGVERITWIANDRVQIAMIYNNAQVIVTASVTDGALAELKVAKGEQAHPADRGPSSR